MGRYEILRGKGLSQKLLGKLGERRAVVKNCKGVSYNQEFNQLSKNILFVPGMNKYIGTIIFAFPRPDAGGFWFQETKDGESSFILNGVTYRGWNYHKSWLEFL
jgi:hypothetical protein